MTMMMALIGDVNIICCLQGGMSATGVNGSCWQLVGMPRIKAKRRADGNSTASDHHAYMYSNTIRA